MDSGSQSPVARLVIRDVIRFFWQIWQAVATAQKSLARALRYNSAKIAQRVRIMANPNPVPKFQKGHKKPRAAGARLGRSTLN